MIKSLGFTQNSYIVVSKYGYKHEWYKALKNKWSTCFLGDSAENILCGQLIFCFLIYIYIHTYIHIHMCVYTHEHTYIHTNEVCISWVTVHEISYADLIYNSYTDNSFFVFSYKYRVSLTKHNANSSR